MVLNRRDFGINYARQDKRHSHKGTKSTRKYLSSVGLLFYLLCAFCASCGLVNEPPELDADRKPDRDKRGD
jgi:hypothetical protein